ncbi:hypothetical protein V6N13_072248 [Hibiscus sabdariffa]
MAWSSGEGLVNIPTIGLGLPEESMILDVDVTAKPSAKTIERVVGLPVVDPQGTGAENKIDSMAKPLFRDMVVGQHNGNRFNNGFSDLDVELWDDDV